MFSPSAEGVRRLIMDRTDDNMYRETRVFYPQEDTLRTLFEEADDPIFLLEPQAGAILDANAAAVEK